jgi:hypothetical protein
MPTPAQEMKAFLSGEGPDDSRRLDVATLFARSMLRELRAAVAEWEATAATIEEARALRPLSARSAPRPSGSGRGRGFAKG